MISLDLTLTTTWHGCYNSRGRQSNLQRSKCSAVLMSGSSMNILPYKLHENQVARMGKLMGRIMIVPESRGTISGIENLVNAKGQSTMDNYQKVEARRDEVFQKIEALKKGFRNLVVGLAIFTEKAASLF